MSVPHPCPIILVGMMLSGKTTIGRRLADHLGWSFLDLDAEIEERSQRSVRQLFEIGEDHFRQIERETLSQILGSERFRGVLSLGGGAFVDPSSRALCNQVGLTVYLSAEPQTLASRYGSGGDRPLLDKDPIAALTEILGAREAMYREAKYALPVDGRTPDELVDLIAGIYEAHH
ncbi:MAG: shikimate kinase [Myxococcales bacterium]|nr:shikimate kinase [Myxococcales bacterium]